MATGNREFIGRLDDRIDSKSMLKHPFYIAWTKGEIIKEALQDYACQYYYHVEAFPRYLSAVHSNTTSMDVRRKILENLNDEESGQPNHPELWLQFAEALGVTEDEIRSSSIQKETQNMVETFQDICRNGTTQEGLGALYAYESQIPAVSETKIDGLKRFYGVTDPEGLAYFTVHQAADVEHSAAEREYLGQLTDTDEEGKVLQAAEEVLDSLWEFLNGIAERHGIVC